MPRLHCLVELETLDMNFPGPRAQRRVVRRVFLLWRFAPRGNVSVSKKVAQERNFCQMNTCHLVNFRHDAGDCPPVQIGRVFPNNRESKTAV